MSESSASQRRVRAAERRRQAFEMRRTGASYATIAQQLQVTPQAAWKMIQTELKKMHAEGAGEREAVRKMELDRLDRMMMGAWRGATNGNKDDILSVLRIMERRAKLIGLDAPSKVSATDPTGEQAAEGGILVLPTQAHGVEEWLQSIGVWESGSGEDGTSPDPDTTPSG